MKKLILIVILFASTAAKAEPSDFSNGPVFTNYGENALIENGLTNPKQQRFKVAFDVDKKNQGEGALRGFNSVARFINMHVRAGVPLKNIDAAIVVHGEASVELMNAEAHGNRFDHPNGSAELLTMMMEKGTKIYLCGQSARYHGVKTADLLDGVEMSLSAMTAHALLQQDGYSLNPF